MAKFCDMCGFAPATERIKYEGTMYNVCVECEARSESEGDDEDE